MTYSELSDFCQDRGILLKRVAASVNMTDVGFKKSIEAQSLPIKNIIPLCTFLGITPHQLLGYNDAGDTVYGGQNKNGRKQRIYNNDPATLNVLREQLKTKDAQIEKLLSIIASK